MRVQLPGTSYHQPVPRLWLGGPALATAALRRARTEGGLGRPRKRDPEKLELARLLRARTTMTLTWVAERRKTGARICVSSRRVQKRKNDQKCH